MDELPLDFRHRGEHHEEDLARALRVVHPGERAAEDDSVPERLRSLVTVLGEIREADLPVMEAMAQALCDKRTAEDDAERFAKRAAVLDGDDDAYARDELEGLKLAELQAIAVRVGHGLAGIKGLDEAALVELILEAGK